MIKRFFMLAMLLVASVSPAKSEETGPWEISVGTDSVITFQLEFVPKADYCYVFTVTGQPDQVFVSPVYPGKESLTETWAPEGKPQGIYVFMIDLKTRQVDVMAWGRFMELDIIKEVASRKRASAYKGLACQGKTERGVWVFPVQIDGKEFVAATSFDSKKKVKRTFGIPSIIPFMGRQKWIEKKTTFSGTLYLEVFSMDSPATPLVQFKRRFRNHIDHATVPHLAAWVPGVRPPLLVVMESTDQRTNRKGRIFLVHPLSAASQ